MGKLSDSEIDAALSELAGWTRQGNALERQFTFPTFPDAVAFVVRLAFDAEAKDHHPDATISFRRVTVRWSTHSEGGITKKDVDGARTSDRLAG